MLIWACICESDYLIIWSIGFNCSDLLLVATWQSAIHALYGIHKVNSSLELRFYSLSHGKREYLLRAEGKNDILQKNWQFSSFFLFVPFTEFWSSSLVPSFLLWGKTARWKEVCLKYQRSIRFSSLAITRSWDWICLSLWMHFWKIKMWWYGV